MKYDWPSMRKAFFIGLLMTGAGIFLAMFTGWNEATILFLVIGPILLISFLVLALFSGWMARSGASRLPEGWDQLSPEAKRDVAIKRAREESNKGNIGATVSLQLMRLHRAQKRHVDASSTENDD